MNTILKTLGLLAFAATTSHAQTKSVEVLDPGTISLEIPETEKNAITDLTVTGQLNGTDMLYLIEMAGTTVYHDKEKTAGQLIHLNLDGAQIVEGGVQYSKWPNYSTSLNTVGSNMFKFTQLESLTLPAGTTAIGDNAFDHCAALTALQIPASVTSIGSYAFHECFMLTTLTIPEGVTAIKDGTFMSCTALHTIKLPSTLTSIGSNAFNNTAITSLRLPAALTNVGYDALSPSLTEIHIEARDVPTTVFNSFRSVNFSKCTLYIPKGTIDLYRADAEWSKFTKIIEEEAQTGPTSALEVTLTESGTLSKYISEEIAPFISSLKLIGPIDAADLAFIRNMAGSDENFNPTSGMLTDLDMEEVTIVAKENLAYAYHPYSSPENPIPLCIFSPSMDANNMLPAMAFEGCHIEHIVLPNSLVTLASAFTGCPLKGTIIIPEGVTHIRDYAFAQCSQLEGIVLPSSLRNVGKEDYLYPYAIGAHAFEGCSSLQHIDLPEGVTVLPDCIFAGTSINSITLSEKIERIDSRALSIPTLTQITVERATPPSATYEAFLGVNYDTCALIIPEGSEQAYRSADEWCHFFGLELPDGLRTISSSSPEAPLTIYDLSGRRMQKGIRGISLSPTRKMLR